MMDYLVDITIIIFLSVAIVCAIILEILMWLGRKFEKNIKQCEELMKAVDRGVSHEELMKMPMSKKIRKELEKSHLEYQKLYNEIQREIKQIEEAIRLEKSSHNKK